MLQSFCCKPEDEIPEIERPWSSGDYTHATNGHIMIRVPRRRTVPHNPKAPKGERIDQMFSKGRQHEPNDYVPVVAVECPSRTIKCDCGCDSECDYCHGKGKYETANDVEVLGLKFSGIYINKIAALPDCRIAVGKRSEAAHFTFTGGEGLIMPLRM
jgi:sulfatase maturation enzyme AslB (radical SAM superfamily)